MEINNPQYYKEKGLEYLNNGFLIESTRLLEQYLSIREDDIDVLCLVGDAYSGLKNNNRAREYYLKGLKLDPTNMNLLLKYSSVKLCAPEYKEVLKLQHSKRKPKRYIEIGVCRGESFKLVDENATAIGVDPEPQLDVNKLPHNHIVVSDTSDDFFKTDRILQDLNGKPFDMAFLDGMHVFEFLLRDFMNLEKYSHSDSVVFVHDLYPITEETATRVRKSDFWSGDVWKLVPCLQEYRPDLQIEVLPCPPTGLGVISNLDANSSVIYDNYDEILEKYVDISFGTIENEKDKKLLLSGLDSQWLS